MSKEPWLDALSDDWVSQPRSPSSPATPAFTSSFNNQSRRSSLRSSPSGPSRIPVPVRRPGQQTQQAQQTPGSENKKVPRLCYFMKPRDDGTPSRVKTPAKKKPKNNTKPSPGSGRRQSTGKVTRNSPLRSVSNASDQSTQSGTVQRRPGKGNGGDATPEWRRKLVRGENPGGGQCDLFAPMKLESVFKPPTPGSEDARRETFSFLNKTDSRWAFTNSASGQHQDTKGGKEDGRISEGQEPQHHEDPDNNSLPESPTESISKGRDARRASPSTSSNHEGSSNSDDRLRTVSGREELRNEGITPISLSRDDTFNAPSDVIKSALKKLNRHRDRMSMSHKERPGSRASDSGLLYQQSGVGDDLLPPDDLLEMTSQSLPKDLSMGTLDVAARRAFANLRRSSLRHRHLSPSSLPSPSTLATSKLRSSPPPGDPETPNPARPAVTLRPQPSDPKANRSNPAAMKPSGSPLKLFGDHDTFTNNKLLRRMSQFEETFADISEEDEPASPSEKPRRKGAKNSLPSLSSGDPHEQASRPGSQDATDPRMNRFGDGQLDDFGFPDKISSPQDLPQKVFEAPSPVPQESPEERHRSSRSSRQDGPGKSKTVDSTSEKRRSRDHQRMPLLKTAAGRRESTANQLRRRDISEVKRALNTPVRDSTPKRRRTLRRANSPPRDYEETLDMVTGSMENLSLLQRSLIRQGIKHEAEASEFNAPKTQQPKTPTPAQKRPSRGQWLSTSRGQSNQDLANKFDQSKGNDIPTNKAIPPAGVAGAMEESRRGSITTQDFLDEATKIMNIIRAKGRPKSGLTNVEESGEESQENGGESYVDESTPEEFSRPPSREGVVTRNLRKPREQNPRVVSHLKKFEDKDESELLMGTSVTSLHLDKQRNATSSSRDARQGQGREIENGVERSPQNIRIRENPFVQRKRKHSSRSTDGESNPHNATTVHTQASSNNSSTGRSVPTGSSHGSNAKGVISSDMISHLIPEQVNGMTYDRSNHMWVKKSAEESPDKQRGDDSEEDPFQGIPDLSVDELQELMRVQELTSPEKTKDTRSAERESNGANIQSKAGKSEGKSFDFRPQPKDGEPSIPDTSSIQSRSTHFTSSVPKPETRATSWGTGELSVKPVRRSDRSGNEQRSKEPAHEVNLHEGRMSAAPQRQDASARQPRAVTISFSSPLVSHVAYAENDSPAGSDQGSSSHSREKGVKPEPIARNHDEPHPKVQSRHKTTVRSPSPRTSLDGRPFIRSSISRIDEQNEETVNEQSLVRRDDGEPESDQPEQPLLHPPSGHDASYSFHLSPLPDFTVNQIDDPLQLEVSYVALRTHPTSLREVHGTFTLAVEDLVKHITDVEPYEPYWEHLRRLDLRRKGLITIHRLNDFCPRLEELDVSYNDIGQLSGAPSTLRHLRIQRNCISGLTAWGHLKNLQYLDVSGNDLDNLDGFSGLIHLRELRANNNKIRNLDGILDLDGLLSLKLRGNALTEVDFEGSELTRLSDIDLSNNRLTSVRNLQSLPSLEVLDLSSNKISDIQPSTSLRNLRSLKLSNNRLSRLDVSSFPSLTLLYLDKNHLSAVSGLDKCYHLEVLSIREQTSPEHGPQGSVLDIDLGLMKDVRKVFLSSNKLSPRTLSPSAPVLSMQLLDIASCALHSLPTDFASNFPNLRVLNLNFNALADVGELVGIKCLSRLALVGNRISRLRRLCQVLSRLSAGSKGNSGTLKRVDLRGNPLTVGFYPPAVSGSGRSDHKARELKAKEGTSKRDEDGGETMATALASIGGCADIARTVPRENDDSGDVKQDVEIDDPYVLPPADAEADKKYLSRLDESTKLRRRVVELMLYVGTGGTLKVLDGLEFRPALGDEGTDMEHAWSKLEELGVLKKRDMATS